nr:MAG TPA: tail tape measure protein [Podoviridae sp. ct13o21]
MNLLDLFVKISVDDGDVDKGFSETSSKAETLAGKLKGGLATAAKVGGAAIVAAGAAAVAITKQAVENYGEYEQLVGGVETLFKSSADTVMQYAANAYQTAGMSANEYMTTVTAFSASLLQSMGGDTDAAAEKANLAITDMSDNANKMGSSMESIQNAYSGFAKQNYTMLDNLKLGYGGTKEEMQRLLDDANALNAAQGNYTNYTIDSYADIVDAIHTVQTEMGITGTTQLEASTTIQGSIASMKASYDNFITGLGDENADMAELITNLLGSTVTVAENLLPVVERILENIGVVVQEKGPEMIEKFVSYAIDKLPDIIELGLQMVIALVKGLAQNLPQLVTGVLNMAATIIKTLVDSIPDVIEVGKDIVRGVWDGIKAMGSWIKEKVSGFFGGIVDNVKGVLGIHSPSRVFAGIGENMALGLGEGWDNEYGTIKRGITNGLDFGTASVGFADSGIGRSSAAIVNGMGVSTESGTTTINLMFPDGTKLASYLLPFSIKAAAAAGTPIANAQMA